MNTHDYNPANLAKHILGAALACKTGVAVWIERKSGEVVVLRRGAPLTECMLDGSASRDGLIGAYVGVYKAPCSIRTILQDLRAHDAGVLAWRQPYLARCEYDQYAV